MTKSQAELSQEQIKEIADSLNKAIEIIKNATPNNSNSNYKHKVNKENIDVIESVAEYASEHPSTTTATLNVKQWIVDLKNIKTITPLIELTKRLLNAEENLVIADSIDAMEDFRKYYQSIKILVADGLQEAKTIWPEVKSVYARYYGRKNDKESSVEELNLVIERANQVLVKNKPRLNEVLSNEVLLAKNLENAIHKEDDIVSE